MMNSFGDKFRVTVFGSSHGPAVGVVMDGVPAGMPLSEADFATDLDRRRPGAAGTTARVEKDVPKILSGVCDGRTTGAAVTVAFENGDARPGDYEAFREHPRPSHADFAARIKYGGANEVRGGGQFSGRMTVALVAAGVVARKVLGDSINISARVVEVGGSGDRQAWDGLIARAADAGDSLGGVVECVAEGVPVGWGEPFFDSVESVAAHLLFSVPGVKGVEFGSGFAGAAMRGSQNNDPIADASGRTMTNNAGGINGGIANGNPVVVRVAVKPAPSIAAPQQTFNFGSGRVEALSIGGRHDVCIALRVPVVAEACVAVALAQFMAG